MRITALLAVGCLVAMAAWLVHKRDFVARESAAPSQIPEPFREPVAKALEYLVGQQFPDGHWEGDGGQHPVAVTALAGLALFMEADPPIESGLNPFLERPAGLELVVHVAEPPAVSKYEANIRKAADWLMDQSVKRDGLIFSEHPSETAHYMEGHGLATLFLAGILRREEDNARGQRMRDVLTRAVKYIAKAQSSRGGWHHTSKVEGHDLDDILATVIQVQALQAAVHAGIPVGPAIIEGQEYLKTAFGKNDQGGGSDQSGTRPRDAAAAFAGVVETKWTGQTKLVERWFKYCRTAIPVGGEIKHGHDEVTQFYYAQAAYLEGSTWADYRAATFNYLKQLQTIT